jgi:hypothetical protein
MWLLLPFYACTTLILGTSFAGRGLLTTEIMICMFVIHDFARALQLVEQ